MDPITMALISSMLPTLIGAAQTGGGLFTKTKQPEFKIPSEYNQLGKLLSTSREMPGYQTALAKLMGREGTAINAIREATPASNVTGAIVQAEANTENAMNNLSDKRAAYQDQNKMRYAGFLREKAGVTLQKQAFDNRQKEMEQIARSELLGTGLQNLGNAANTFGETYYTADTNNKYLEMLTGTKPSTPPLYSGGVPGYKSGDWYKNVSPGFNVNRGRMDLGLAFAGIKPL